MGAVLRYYGTEYELNGVKFAFFIYAKNLTTAKEIATRRGIGEVITGELCLNKGFEPLPLPSGLYVTRDLPACLHTLSFYVWIASRAGHNLLDVMFSDHGIIHELVHEIQFPLTFSYREPLHTDIKSVETLVLGLRHKLK